MSKWKLPLYALVCIALILGGVILGESLASGSTFWISQGIYPGAPSYTVWNEGSTYFEKDAFGEIQYESSNASQIFINTISIMSDNQTLFIKGGVYELGTYITLRSNMRIEAEKGATLRAANNFPGWATLPAWHSMLIIPQNFHDIEISGVTFNTNSAGNVVYGTWAIISFDSYNINIHDNTLIDLSSTGYAAHFFEAIGSGTHPMYDNRNIQITSNLMYLPNSLSGIAFGSSMVAFNSVTDGEVSHNIKVGLDTFVYAGSSRNILVNNNDIYGLSGIVDLAGQDYNIVVSGNIMHKPYPTIVPSPKPYGVTYSIRMWQSANGYNLTNIQIENNFIEGDKNYGTLGAYGVFLEISQATGYADNIKIRGNTIPSSGGDYGVYINVPEAQTLNGIEVSGNSFPGTFANEAFYKAISNSHVIFRQNIINGKPTENSGVTSSIASGTWIAHGLPDTPTLVVVTPHSLVSWDVYDRNSTHFQIEFNSGSHVIDWYAEYHP